MIAEVVDQGRMPPWHADPKYGNFSDDRRLSDDEKRLIPAWVGSRRAAGRSEGTAADADFCRQRLAQQPAARPDPADERQTYHVKAEGVLSYQNFRVDPHFTEDKWIEAAEILPGNRAVVHHVLVHYRAGPRRAWRRMAGQRILAAYVPGLRPLAYPKGMAKRIPAGSKLTFQIHYTPNGPNKMTSRGSDYGLPTPSRSRTRCGRSPRSTRCW